MNGLHSMKVEIVALYMMCYECAKVMRRWPSLPVKFRHGGVCVCGFATDCFFLCQNVPREQRVKALFRFKLDNTPKNREKKLFAELSEEAESAFWSFFLRCHQVELGLRSLVLPVKTNRKQALNAPVDNKKQTV